jgi:hypothetical protein
LVKIIGNPYENQRFGARSAPPVCVFWVPIPAKTLEILVKLNVSAREARRFFEVLDTHLDQNH